MTRDEVGKMATSLRTFSGFPLRRRGRKATLLRMLALTGAALVALLRSQASEAAQREFTADLASRIIQGCVTHAKARGQSHAIAVYAAFDRISPGNDGRRCCGSHWRKRTS